MHEIVLLLNSDEEVGSPVSRPITERLAARVRRCLCPGAGAGSGLQDRAQRHRATGGSTSPDVAAHAGVDFEKGASAIRELARVVETVSSWTDLKRGFTVSVGVAGGGTKTNVIPAEAWAEVDVRIARKADGPRIERKFAALKPVDKRCTLTVTGGINRPPMERTPRNRAALSSGQGAGRRTRLHARRSRTGGASDGNFTSALGIPTLDGLGAVGEGAHATPRVHRGGASGSQNRPAGWAAGGMINCRSA